MSYHPTRTPTRIVILGGGFAGLYTFKRLHKFFHGDTNVQISLVSNRNYFLFTPLLHEVATGSVSPTHIVEPIRETIRCCLHEFVQTDVERISPVSRIIHTSVGDISYDYCVVALGSETEFYGIPGAEEYSFMLKSLEDALALKSHIINVFEQASIVTEEAELKKLLHFIIVGGGPTGVELSAEIIDLCNSTFKKIYPRELASHASVTVLQRSHELLPHMEESLRRRSEAILQKIGINVRFGAEVVEVGEDFVKLGAGEKISAGTVVWTAGVKPNDLHITDGEGVMKERGKIVVNEFLHVPDKPSLFAIGDIAHAIDQNGSVLPAVAQVATREAEVVAYNIHSSITKRKMKKFIYKPSGNLVSLGQWMAAGEIAGFSIAGHLTWLLWRSVYISKLVSWEDKFKVALDWILNIFSPRDISEFRSSKN